MANLTFTAHIARQTIKYGGIGIIVFLILQMGVASAIEAYKKAHPPYIPPTMKYGKLPRITFPQKEFSKKVFNLELPNDSFPKFSDQSKVFIIYRPVDSLLALDEDTKTAKSLQFSGQPKEVKTGVYEWENNVSGQKLTMNVLDGSFKMEYPFLNDQVLLNPEKMPSRNEAIEMAKSFLSQADKLPDDLSEGEQKISYWQITFEGLKAVNASVDANIIQIDLFRKNIDDNFKILTSEPKQASVSVLVTGATVESKKIAQVNYKYVPVDRQSFSTYPIKPVNEAWQELQGGNYWPASDSQQSNITIRRVYLAYYEPAVTTQFLQPIYVFEGDNNFMAYIPAVDDSMMSK